MTNSDHHCHDALGWLAENLAPQESDAATFWYDRMESQSGKHLPVIYVPFDGCKRGHFVDRAQILDFALSTGRGKILDFGPGDGWPSLLIAPMVEEVVGVDASRRRVEVCTANARRLGIENARFVHVPPGGLLPFDDATFDGAAAASSIEQTPDVPATLRELRRVLKPGGKLRVSYESLAYYRGNEREIALGNADEKPNRMLIFDRLIEEERVHHLGLRLDLSREQIVETFTSRGLKPSYAALTPEVLKNLCGHLVEAATWTTRHPSCRTFLRLLRGAGFTSATPTHDGGRFAKHLFDRLDETSRPATLEAVDAMLRPLVEVVIGMQAPAHSRPGEWDPMITATR